MKHCTTCGAQLADEAKFCTGCGAPVVEAAPQPTYAPPQPTYAPPQPTYAPPQPTYAPPQPTYAPPQPTYTPPQPTYAPPQPTGYGYSAPIQRSPVKTDHNLLMYILLSIITCGIYGYYIIYKLAQDVNQICAEDGDSIGGLGMYILLSIVTCGLYSYYWLYKIQNRLQAAAPRYGTYVAENGTTVLLWAIVGSLVCGIGAFIAIHLVFKAANNVGMAYNARYFYH